MDIWKRLIFNLVIGIWIGGCLFVLAGYRNYPTKLYFVKGLSKQPVTPGNPNMYRVQAY